MDNQNYLAENLHYLMVQHAISIVDLCKFIDISPATLKKLRSGEQPNPTLSTLIELAKYFDVSLDDLVYIRLKDKQVMPEITFIPWLKFDDLSNEIDFNQNKHFPINYKSDTLSFALDIKGVEYDTFGNHNILIIDTGKTFKPNDYVLVKNKLNKIYSIKQVMIHDDQNTYLHYIEELNVSTLFNPKEYEIVGVVMVHLRYY